jgi:hypothetical protein
LISLKYRTCEADSMPECQIEILAKLFDIRLRNV